MGSFVFALVMLLSNVGGIGGGGVAIPLVMVFFNFSMKPAIAISSFSIMCATLARFFFNFNERHPEKENCTSIEYGMTNVMMPLILIGSLIGAYVYVSFPDLVLQIILTILLFILMMESGRKFRETYNKETKAKEAAAAAAAAGEAEAPAETGRKDTDVGLKGDGAGAEQNPAEGGEPEVSDSSLWNFNTQYNVPIKINWFFQD